jgi:hypothetical protein
MRRSICLALTILGAAVPAAQAESPGTPGLSATMSNRAGDVVLGAGPYADAQRNVMVTWNLVAVDGDVFALQVFNDRPLRLVVSGQSHSCGYGAVRIGGAGDLHDVQTSALADAYVECYDSAARRNGWSINYSPCVLTERVDAATWRFTSDGCPGALTRTTKSKAGAPVAMDAPFQMTGHQS